MPWDIYDVFWVLTFALLIVVEAFTAGVVSIWFAFGALAAFVASMFDVHFVWQLMAFVVVSAITLVYTRPIIKKWLNVKITKTNVDAILGRIGVVTEPVFQNEFGEIKIDGVRWTAKLAGDGPLERGELVEVIAVEGVKLIVKKQEK